MKARQLPCSVLFLLGAILVAGCDAPTGALEADLASGGDAVAMDPYGSDRSLTPAGDLVEAPSGYVVGPQTLAVFVGEDLVVELELLEPDAFSLRAGAMPEDAEFTQLPSGGVLFWQPGMEDVGTHEFSLLVVDSEETNLVISQEMLVVDVFPRHRFIEYGF